MCNYKWANLKNCTRLRYEFYKCERCIWVPLKLLILAILVLLRMYPSLLLWLIKSWSTDIRRLVLFLSVIISAKKTSVISITMDIPLLSCVKAAKHWYIHLSLKNAVCLKLNAKLQFVLIKFMELQLQQKEILWYQSKKYQPPYLLAKGIRNGNCGVSCFTKI